MSEVAGCKRLIVEQGNVCSTGAAFCVMSNKRNRMADLSLDASPCQAWLQWCADPATDWESLIGQPDGRPLENRREPLS